MGAPHPPHGRARAGAGLARARAAQPSETAWRRLGRTSLWGLAEHPVLLAKGYALVAVVEQEGKTVAGTPMTAAMNGTSGPAR